VQAALQKCSLPESCAEQKISFPWGEPEGMDPVNHSTASTLQPVDSPKCWNSREIVAMDLYRVINFKGRSPESNLKKEECNLSSM